MAKKGGKLAEMMGQAVHKTLDLSIFPSQDELAREQRRLEENRYNQECGPVKVYKLGEEHKAVIVPAYVGKPIYQPEDLTKKRLIEECKEGLTARQIGEKYGLPEYSVHYRKGKWGLTHKNWAKIGREKCGDM